MKYLERGFEMDRKEGLAARIKSASGAQKASLVLKHGGIVNVFTNEIDYMDVAIEHGYIVGLGQYDGDVEEDLTGMIICPGFLDGHIHLESSMVTPYEFEQAVLPHGTTAVITDPHEIANVAGVAGIDYMMQAASELDLDVYFMMPSCVPATALDESGAVLDAGVIKPYYQCDHVLGLAEMMNFYGTVLGETWILDQLDDAANLAGVIDGHAPGLGGNQLNAYITAGVKSDHECSDFREAYEKLRRGQWIMIREGTAAKNLDALMPLFQEPYYNRVMLVTDDKHPGDLLRFGHIDYIIRKAVELGADPIHAVKMGSYHTANYFGLKDRGAVAPGYRADLAIVSSLKCMDVKMVYKAGILVAKDGVCLVPGKKDPVRSDQVHRSVFHSFHMEEIGAEDLKLKEQGNTQRVICLTNAELITTERLVPWCGKTKPETAPGVDLEADIIKMAVFERHHHTGHVGLGFLHGYGLKTGAVATSVAHDSHNLIVVGTNDEDMALAGNLVRKNQGGLAIVVDGVVLGELPLPIAGLMSERKVAEVDDLLEQMKAVLRRVGIPEQIDPFMTLAFASLPVIPKLRLNTYGVIDVDLQMVVPAVFNQ